MAKTYIFPLAAVLLLFAALQVYGRSMPDRPIRPEIFKGEFKGRNEFANQHNDAHVKQRKQGTGSANGYGVLSGDSDKNIASATGNGDASTDGNDHGSAWADGKSLGVVKLDDARAGGYGKAKSDSHNSGSGYAFGHGEGFAKNRFNDVHKSEAVGKAVSAGGGHGKSTNSGKAAGFGADSNDKTGSEVSTHTHAKNHANANAHGHSSGKVRNENSATETVNSDSYGEANVHSRAHGSKATGKGDASNAGKSNDEFARTKGKGTAEAVNKGNAHGSGYGSATNTKIDSQDPFAHKADVSSGASASANKRKSSGGAKGTGHGEAKAGDKNDTLATTKSDAVVKTGTKNPSGGTKAWAGSKQKAVIKGEEGGTLYVSGSAAAHAEKNHGTANAHGHSEAVKSTD